MTRELSESVVVRELAEDVCRRITCKVVRALKAMPCGGMISSGCGPLNFWEEICADLQRELELNWAMHEDTPSLLVAAEVTRLQSYEQDAVWLQTPAGKNWAKEGMENRKSYPVVADDVVAYLTERGVHIAAYRNNNRRIRDYMKLPRIMD